MKYVSFSLDCELAWGFADLEPPVDRIETMKKNPSSVRNAYQTILDTFDAYDVPATFAFVGHLFLDQCTRDTHIMNDLTTPADPHGSIDTDPLYYAPDLVEKVADAEINHDIGAHSFSHPDFQELDRELARAELEATIRAAADRGINIESFVYPRNYVEYPDLLSEYGIKTYRGTTVGENYILRRGIRPFLKRDRDFWRIPPVRPTATESGVVRIDGSRLLHEVRWSYIHPIRLRRTIDEMGDGDVAHFCFHPHDMLAYFKLDWVLDRLLSVVESYREQGDVEVVTMADMPDIVRRT